MIKKSLLYILIFTVFACKENKTSNVIADNVYKNNTEVIQSDYYCNVSLGDDKESVEYEVRSSNALRKGTITTTFNLLLSEQMYEKHPLDISFSKVQNTTNPKLKKGTYSIEVMTLVGQDTLMYFSIGENIISEKTYHDAINSNFLDDIQDSYVLLSKEPNEFIIESVKDIGNVDESDFYTSGKQQMFGTLTAYLLKVVTKEKVILKVDFKCLHEWSISK